MQEYITDTQMTMYKLKFIVLVLNLIVCSTLLYLNVTAIKDRGTDIKVLNNVYNPTEGSPKDNLYDALVYAGVKYPDIAYSIAIVETGWFKSRVCTEYNNLFGMYDSKAKDYYKFNSWYKSVEFYRDVIEKKYTSAEGYYKFLDRLPYSTTPGYTEYIRKITEQQSKKRKEDENNKTLSRNN